MDVEILNEAAYLLSREYINGIFVAVHGIKPQTIKVFRSTVHAGNCDANFAFVRSSA
jgi:hypothetical protein